MNKYLQILFCLIFLFSKNNSQTKQESNLKDGIPVNLEEYEKSFDASKYDHSFKLLPNRLPTKLPEVKSNPDENSSISTQTLQGFRIQIIATDNYTEAMDVKTNFLKLDSAQSVYIIFDAPNYKLRVGNFQLRADASKYLEQLKFWGYNDAWVVQDRIVNSINLKK